MSLLENVRIRFIPLLRFKYIHNYGGNITIQFDLIRAIITSIQPDDKYSQTITINKLRLQRPELARHLANQLVRIADLKEKSKEENINKQDREVSQVLSLYTNDQLECIVLDHQNVMPK